MNSNEEFSEVNNNIERESDNNMEENVERIVCFECGELVDIEDTIELPSGDRVCNSCYEDNYFTCDRCGEIHHIDDSTSVDNGDMLVCDNCIDNYYFCEDCNNYFSDAHEITTHSGSDYYVCDHCFEYGDYYYCDGCGNYFYNDDMRYCEEEDRWYCDECYSEHMEDMSSDRVCSYHAHKGMYEDNILHLDNESVEDTITYGTETEMENVEYSTSNESELLSVLSGCGLKPVFESDGSLDSTGVEMITMPYTYDYLMAHVEDIESAFKRAIELGYRADKEHCGIHIHVKRPNDEVIDRIWLIMETFKNEIIKVARRHNEHYAHFISDYTSADSDILKSLYYVKKNKSNNDRYYALNLTNSKTIEFRLFKGTLNYRTWLAYQQFIHNIMVECSNLDKNVEDIKWEDLIQGEYISELVEKRNIVCYTRVVDNTKRIEDKKAQRDKIIDSVNKLLKKYGRELLSDIKIDKSKFDSIEDLYSRLDVYRNGRFYAIMNILDSTRNLERCIDSDISIEEYIVKVKNYVQDNNYYANEIQLSDTMKQAILDLVSVNNEMGGEE